MDQSVSVFELITVVAALLAVLASLLALFVTRYEHRDLVRRIGRIETEYDDLRRGRGYITTPGDEGG